MPETPENPGHVYLTPHGLLLVESGAGASPWLDLEMGRRVAAAFQESAAKGLLHLATRELDSVLPPVESWWRELARRHLTELCHTPDLENVRTLAALPPPEDAVWRGLIETAPPMRGGEYLSGEVLDRLWLELDKRVRAEVAGHAEGAGAWLRARNPLWRMVGRVTFHLAENKRNPAYPFAFMATYAARISSQSRVQHLPLGRALQDYAGAKNKAALINLLSPVQKAAEQGAMVRELVDTGRIFKALPWSPAEAYRFLKEAPVCEAAGIIIRLPDWWKSGRPPRPQVSVRVGEKRVAGVGADALLDFSLGLTLGDQNLTPEELQALLQASEGLALVRGQWIEVNPDKLREALAHWKKVEHLAGEGRLTFFEGMRLLSGFDAAASRATADGTGEPGADREWTGIQAGEWLNQVLAELREPRPDADAGAIPGLNAQLRPYQATGVHWLDFLARLGLGGCLADDMGLGKTIQVLAMLLKRKQALAGKRPPSLLVVPASLLANWRAEIEKFTPDLRHLIIHPSEGEPPPALLNPTAAIAADLIITTYGMLGRMEALRQRTWDLAILDEAQAIKNPGTRQTRAVKEIKAAGRFALTGTPVENRVGDLWSIFDFLNPGLLGSASTFAKFIRVGDGKTAPNYGPVRLLTRPYLLRRLKTDKRVIADLPDKTEVRAWCPLTKTQAGLYQKAVTELAEALENADGIQRKGLVLAFIMRFKQICNHPSQWLNDAGYAPQESGKFARLRELTEEIADRQEKVLVFTQFREITEPLAAYLAEIFQRPGLVLHGGTAVGRRRQLVESFQREDGPPFFILTVKAGGAGLNLTQAAQVIHFDRWWNPAVENQATDRAFRIGQKSNVLVHKFICRGTIEERIDQVIEDKKSLSAELLEGGGERLLTEMNNDELLRFVSLDLQRATET